MGCYARSGANDHLPLAAAALRRPTLLGSACRSCLRLPACCAAFASSHPTFARASTCSSLRVADSPGHQPAVLSQSTGVSPSSIGALHLAAWHGDGARVQQLLADGASVHVTDADGWTATHYAVRGRSLRCAAQLLAAGAQASAPAGPLRHTPLHFAAAAGEPALVAALLAAGSCPRVADATGRTPLALAVQHLAAVQAAERTAPYQQPAGVLQKALAAVSLLQGAAVQAPAGQSTRAAGGEEHAGRTVVAWGPNRASPASKPADQLISCN